MNRHGESDRTSGFAVDVMAAVDAQELPAGSLDEFGELRAGEEFHTMISTRRSFPVAAVGSTSTERQPSTAS